MLPERVSVNARRLSLDMRRLTSPDTNRGGDDRAMGDDSRLKLLGFLLHKNEWLEPRISRESVFGYAYPEISSLLNYMPGEEISELTFLASNGYLDTRHRDKVHLCPACNHYNLNFREVCTSCASSDIEPTTHIHHFPCGYVGPEPEYRRGLDYVCPKCNKVLRHIGIDYEEPSAPFMCHECAAVFADADVSCVCLNCEARFDVGNAIKHPIFQYRINPQGANAVEIGKISESEHQLYDPDFPVYNQAALTDHLEQLFNNSTRYGTELTVLQVQFNLEDGPADYVAPRDISSWLRQVILRIKESVRVADVVGMLKQDTLAILMPGTGELAIEPVCEKLHRALLASERKQYVEHAIAVNFTPTVFSSDMKFAEQMLEESQAAVRTFQI